MIIQPPFLGAHNQYSQDKDLIWNPKEIHMCLLEIVCSSRYKEIMQTVTFLHFKSDHSYLRNSNSLLCFTLAFWLRLYL